MPRIKNIQKDTTLTKEDKLLGSDVTGATRNYTLEDIASFVEAENSGVYKHNQNNASTTWTITHNLDLEDYLPHVNMKLSGGAEFNNVQALGIVTYVNKNELTISLVKSQSGYAYLRK